MPRAFRFGFEADFATRRRVGIFRRAGKYRLSPEYRLRGNFASERLRFRPLMIIFDRIPLGYQFLILFAGHPGAEAPIISDEFYYLLHRVYRGFGRAGE